MLVTILQFSLSEKIEIPTELLYRYSSFNITMDLQPTSCRSVSVNLPNKGSMKFELRLHLIVMQK